MSLGGSIPPSLPNFNRHERQVFMFPNSYIGYWVSQWDPHSTDPVEDLWCNMYGCLQAFSAMNSTDDEDHASALLLEVSRYIPDDTYAAVRNNPRIRDYIRRAREEEEAYVRSLEYGEDTCSTQS